MQYANIEMLIQFIQYQIFEVLNLLLIFSPLIFVIGTLTVLILRFVLSKEANNICYFTKNEVELIKAHSDIETVYGFSKVNNDTVMFLKSKNVHPILFRTFGRIFKLWICLEGYPYVVNMNRLQDLAKKPINEQFFALFKKETLPKIIAKIIQDEFKTRLVDIALGFAFGLVAGFVGVPFYLQYFKFI